MKDHNQYIEGYRELKLNWLNDFNSHHGTTSVFFRDNPGYRYFTRKRPWYLLLKRESIIIEKRKKKGRLNRVELMEGYVQHKLAKWIKRNPCPVEKDDLFYSQEFPKWDALRTEAEERIRDSVVSKYDKLQLIGRFEASDELYKEQEIAQIRDNGETAKHGSVNNLPEDSKVMKKARAITNKTKAKTKTLICTNLRDHKKKNGRILLPNHKTEMRMAAQYYHCISVHPATPARVQKQGSDLQAIVLRKDMTAWCKPTYSHYDSEKSPCRGIRYRGIP